MSAHATRNPDALRSPNAAGKRRPRRSGWLTLALILIVLLGGIAALAIVQMTGQDGLSRGVDLGELAERARARLAQWGLLPR